MRIFNKPSMRSTLLFLALLLFLASVITMSACEQQKASIGNAPLPQTQMDALSTQLKDFYDPALASFGLAPGEYEYYANFWFDGLFSEDEILGLHQILLLSEGDTAPVFYWDSDREVLYTLTATSQGEIHLYSLCKNPNPDDKDFSSRWTKTQPVQTVSP